MILHVVENNINYATQNTKVYLQYFECISMCLETSLDGTSGIPPYVFSIKSSAQDLSLYKY